MTPEEQERSDFLHGIANGDEVYWNDPDGGKCSRVLNVRQFQIYDDDSFVLEEVDGSVVEGFLSELS